MEYQNIIFECEEKKAVITINRPEVRNAIDHATVCELRDAVETVRQDPKIRVVIITGSGKKAFAAGADLNALKERGVLATYYNANQLVFSMLQEMEQIAIAAVNGLALGGGLELALACDIRIASDNAKFGQPELRFGFMPGAGGTQRLPRLIGASRAKEMILTGDIIDAERAYDIGLINCVVSKESLLESAHEMADKIISKAPLASLMTKQIINMGMDIPLKEALALERSMQAVLFSTKDKMEGIEAFFEKRDPEFTGS